MRSPGRYRDRPDAGRALAERLLPEAGRQPVVLGLVRGGLPVADEVARELDAPLDVLVVRKVGAPANPEYGIGAIAEGGVSLLDAEAIDALAIGPAELEAAVARARRQVAERIERYRGGRPVLALQKRAVIVIDDGLATGLTARAALAAVRLQSPRRIVMAAPVGSAEAVDSLADDADLVVCPLQPSPMRAVGLWYDRFEPVEDAEIDAILHRRGTG